VPSDLDESRGGFDVFARRASRDSSGSKEHWRIGFAPEARQGYEEVIVAEIVDRLTSRSVDQHSLDQCLIDVGGGASALTEKLTAWCERSSLIHVVIDSREMCSHLTDHPSRFVIEGRFPDVAPLAAKFFPRPSYLLAYSVLQYVYRDNLVPQFLGAICGWLPLGGVALLGDLPNRDMRIRQLKAAGRALTAADQDIEVRPIGDREILGLLETARHQGVQTYLVPQSTKLPLWRHREDLLLWRQGPYPEV
jgi:hypothetical protein